MINTRQWELKDKVYKKHYLETIYIYGGDILSDMEIVINLQIKLNKHMYDIGKISYEVYSKTNDILNTKLSNVAVKQNFA